MISARYCFLLIALACGALIGTALYMQHIQGLNPCYLCIVQRVFVISTGVLAALAFIQNPGPGGRKIYGLVIAITSFAGGGFSTRQLWLQSLPEEQIPVCGPPADYLFDSFTVSEWLPILLKGDGNCAEIQWTFLGLSIPGWMLICFALIGIFSLIQAVRK